MVDNEIGFLRSTEFRRMAPEIVRMEIRRLGRMIASFDRRTERHNALVRARYELRRFVDGLEDLDDERVEVADPEARLLPHLEAAMLALSLGEGGDGDDHSPGGPDGEPRRGSAESDPGPAGARESEPIDRVRSVQESAGYVLDRLRYVHDRIHLLY